VTYTSVFKAGECLTLGTADGPIVIQVHSKVALTINAPEEVHVGWCQAPVPVEEKQATAPELKRNLGGYWCDQEHPDLCESCKKMSIHNLANFTAFTLDGRDDVDGWHTCGNCDLAWHASKKCNH
jgi:hypothetical protein